MARFWPGLPQLWVRGSWAGLVVAVGFTALTSTVLLATCVYHEWLTASALRLALAAGASLWLGAWWQTHKWRSRAGEAGDAIFAGLPQDAVADPRDAQRDQLFDEAQRAYLKNDWVRTQQLLLKLLKRDCRDVEGRLMLATMWRHQGRTTEALRQLERLERLEASQPWHYEMAALRRMLGGDGAIRSDAAHGNDQTAGDEQPAGGVALSSDSGSLDNSSPVDSSEENRSGPDEKKSTTAAPRRRQAA